MYRVSNFLPRYAKALLGGAGVAAVWVNLSPASYYDMIVHRLLDKDPARRGSAAQAEAELGSAIS